LNEPRAGLQDDVRRYQNRERIAARFPHFFAPADTSEDGMQDESSTVSTDETGMLTPTTTEAGDSEIDGHN
jgi:hypothetical protein